MQLYMLDLNWLQSYNKIVSKGGFGGLNPVRLLVVDLGVHVMYDRVLSTYQANTQLRQYYKGEQEPEIKQINWTNQLDSCTYSWCGPYR